MSSENKQHFKRLETKFNKGDHAKDDYLIHEKRSLFLKKSNAIKILDDFDVPYYANNKVHFKDVCKKVVNNTFDSKQIHVEIGVRLK